MSKAVVVDGLNQDYREIAVFFGDDAIDRAVNLVDQLKDAETGRYGVDISEFCEECGDWHHTDAECEGTIEEPELFKETYGVGWPD